MQNQHQANRYYVPPHSAWPILGAVSLLFLTVGSLNLGERWGVIAFSLGLGGVLFMLCGWLWSVSKESDAGLYTQQMDKTFRWGMFWFLISELFLFGLLLGSIFHVRFSITPWLAGQSGASSLLTHYLLWPDFSRHWPLITPPAHSTNHAATSAFISLRDIPFTTLILLLASTFSIILALPFFKKGHYTNALIALSITSLIGFIVLILQLYYFFCLIKVDIIAKTGIYGSLFITFLGLHAINIAAVSLLLISSIIRIYRHKINFKNTFSLDACVWWWCFLTGVWLLGFLLLF